MAMMERVLQGACSKRAVGGGNTAASPVRKTLRSLRKKIGIPMSRTARSSRKDANEWIGNDQFGWYRGS